MTNSVKNKFDQYAMPSGRSAIWERQPIFFCFLLAAHKQDSSLFCPCSRYLQWPFDGHVLRNILRFVSGAQWESIDPQITKNLRGFSWWLSLCCWCCFHCYLSLIFCFDLPHWIKFFWHSLRMTLGLPWTSWKLSWEAPPELIQTPPGIFSKNWAFSIWWHIHYVWMKALAHESVIWSNLIWWEFELWYRCRDREVLGQLEVQMKVTVWGSLSFDITFLTNTSINQKLKLSKYVYL